MPYPEKLSSMTLFSSMIYRVSHAIPVGMLLDIWLGIVKQGGKRMHHYLLSLFIKHDEIIGEILQYSILLRI